MYASRLARLSVSPSGASRASYASRIACAAADQRGLDAQPGRRIELVARAAVAGSCRTHDCMAAYIPRSYSTSSEYDRCQQPRSARRNADRLRRSLPPVPRRNTVTRGGRRNLDAGRAFQAALAEAGLAGLTYAKEYGGAGLTLEHERIYRAVAQEFPPWPANS